MPAFGAYPIADVLTAGDQVSSTYEGRHVTVLESDLIHPTTGDGFANRGQPVVFGTTGLQAVGVVVGASPAAATDLVAIDTEGIWGLDVVASDDSGNSAVAGGDLLYINVTTAVVSKISNQATQIPFGYALGVITGGNTDVIAVKVHFDPSLDNAKRTFITVADGAYVYGKHHTAIFAGGQSTGLEYFDQQVTGVQDGELYGWSSWMELAAGYTVTGGQTVAGEFGIYDAGGTLTNQRVVMLQLQAILASNPGTSLHIFRVNVAAAGGAITAVFAFANPTSAGYVASAATGATKLGGIPLANIVGVGIGWVRLYDAAT